MDFVGTLLDGGASALTGGLFGLVGNIASRTFGYFEARQAFQQRLAEWTHENEVLKLQMQAHAAETEQEIRVAESEGSWRGLEASVSGDAATGLSYPWVNAIRALVRPALTLGLTLFLALAFFTLTPGDAERSYVTDSLVFAAVTAIVWWFGDRAPKKTSH
jgi:hypothetical protein